MKTIFALSSAKGKSGVAVIRISGPAATDAARSIAGYLPPPKQVSLRKLQSLSGEHLDTSLILFLPHGNSYTGYDTVEFHVHGGIATIKSVLIALSRLDYLRMAEPGEFTLQALMNGRLDLAEIEGLGDLIQAETEAQRRQALRLFSGALGNKVKMWRSNLTKCAALLEASLDFSDEELPPNLFDQALEVLTNAYLSLREESVGIKYAERIREGFEVAIVGAPNTGKSTLLNYLAGRDAAITSERAGTTRDVIEIRMELGGLPVIILDLAGLRETNDPVEKIGVEKSYQRANDADLRVFLLDKGIMPKKSPAFQKGDLILQAKADLFHFPPVDGISGKTGLGVNSLTEAIAKELETRSQTAMTAAHARHGAAIKAAMKHLNDAINCLKARNHPEIAAEDMRLSIRELETLIGYVDIENILDEVFAGFCIGK